jgi:hypothetical protein
MPSAVLRINQSTQWRAVLLTVALALFSTIAFGQIVVEDGPIEKPRPPIAAVPKPRAPVIPIQKPQVIAVNSPDGKPLSDRVTAYWIDAQLNADQKTLDATEVLEYRNPSDQPLSSFPFHLYLNAFHRASTFSRESYKSAAVDGGQYHGRVSGPASEGSIEIRSITAEGYGDLKPGMQFTAPDDGNADDRTVMQVTLPKPLAPGEAVRFHITFHDKFPLSVARNGYKGDFVMGGQWFPKVGVFWHGVWNCHQYHETTEFFSDFGTYNVTLRVPNRYVVGASGIETGEQSNHDGTKTLSFRGEDIHDFAWAASPNFVAVDDTVVNRLGTVKLHALVLAEHPDLRQRYLSILKSSLQKYDEWYGPYPYKQITLIDPEPGSNIGGMEYPTLFTADYNWWEPTWYHLPLEEAVVHEMGHQYWYGMVATNEFEEPWLDEGITAYSEDKVLAALFGPNTSTLNARTAYLGETGLLKMQYLFRPDEDPIAREGWKFASFVSYGAIVYGKTATTLTTLESVLGQETLRRALEVYFTRYRFTHPTVTNFLNTLQEVAGRDLEPFLTQAIYGTDMLDYAVDSLTTEPVDSWKGDTRGPWISQVAVKRNGTFVFPVKLEVGFSDGSKEKTDWDGKDRRANFSWQKPARAVYARVDPDNNVALDANTFNNSYIIEEDTTARRKLTNYWIFTQQLLAQWLSFLV